MAFLLVAWKDAETCYYTLDQELLVIIYILKKWKYLLKGVKFLVKIYLDYKNF